MISQLHGTLVDSSPTSALIDVAGVGYELGISGVTAQALPQPGSDVMLFTRLQVRQDALTLFGFATREERAMFDRLIAVSSIGARLALATLSTFTVSQIRVIVAQEDAARMAEVPGVGKKTAQRLILELKSTLEKGDLPGCADASRESGAMSPSAGSAVDDARAALLSMGFSPQEVAVALETLGDEEREMRVESVLAGALRRLGSGA
ncbi:Holliday junction DNA helicase subunit RuvA [Coriobacterium glomerans PW2]|uniref:Holliday junction branch migration complex subunit RuvA n=1 Tax=Coriobacterium glomerans (strain ATCC 49209 / DSM 20642 / JCM 10262 / PW2) TaxID=700015 RepID=F2N884_CORGP|nr:Holliday junction branch migration protein RuvA [Coriobacterium glomerans]AEB07267.1 Holliday junction DNA helicase subunit RuvA [Coriobacterium glomerans PW2]